MALPATFYQHSVLLLSAESLQSGFSDLACLASARRRLGWPKAPKAVGFDLPRTSCLSGRPRYEHCTLTREDDVIKERALSSHHVHRRRLRQQCNALPAIVVEGDEEEGTPWEGAVMFRRSAVQSQFEYETSLERMGLSRLSSENSMALAASMGLKTPGADGAVFTPVQISIDVSKEGRDFRLDGIIRTAMALVCNRCLAPVSERVFATFSVLLTEAPVKEPLQPHLGVVLGADHKIWRAEAQDDGGDDYLDIDLDDKLHFPKDMKEIDLSKYIRDTVHLEIPSQSICDSSCKGVCVGCGVNLNSGTCQCTNKRKASNAVNFEEIMGIDRKRDIWGPLEQLKKQLEEQQDGSAEPQ